MLSLASVCTTAVKCSAIQKDDVDTHSQAKTTSPCDSQTEYDTQCPERTVAKTVALSAAFMRLLRTHTGCELNENINCK
jgi:hypothetical protein